jgi:phosphatidylserine decarboxylase
MAVIKVLDRQTGANQIENIPSGGVLKFLYGHPIGKIGLFLLFQRKFFTQFLGAYMSSRWSRSRIMKFVKEQKINLDEFIVPEKGFQHFNDFFHRKIKPAHRPIGEGIVSPADGRVFGFQRVEESRRVFIKGKQFRVASFLENAEEYKSFEGGAMLIVRLAPVDYHRFHFPASGIARETKRIRGSYFSVSPLALRQSLDIFLENKRSYSVLESNEYGKILYVEVGATVVGSIIQTYSTGAEVNKGEEKGYFKMGGSTVVLFFEPGRVKMDEDILQNTSEGYETLVKMGETIGKKA